MSFLEFNLVGVSILIGLAFARYVEGFLHFVVRARDRHWMLLAAILTQWIYATSYLWSFRGVSNVETPSYALFITGLAMAFGHSFCAYVLVSDQPAQIGNQRAHFIKIKRELYGACMILAVLGGVNTAFFTGGPYEPVELIPFAYGLIIASIGFITNNERTLGAVIFASLAGVLGGSYFLFSSGLA